MAYALLIVEDPHWRTRVTADQARDAMLQMNRYAADLDQRGHLRVGESLRSDATAKRFTTRNGKRLVLDGPFSEAKEMVGGIFLLTCKSREEALALAEQCPAIDWATVELREIGPCDA